MKHILVMGVAGCGKTTLAQRLAAHFDYEFLDADDFHSATAREMMRLGQALNDQDRAPWLTRIRQALVTASRPCVLACSALKVGYRQALAIPNVIFLDIPEAVARTRLIQRQGHFAGESLLKSQFATLEQPQGAIWLDATLDAQHLFDAAILAVGTLTSGSSKH